MRTINDDKPKLVKVNEAKTSARIYIEGLHNPCVARSQMKHKPFVNDYGQNKEVVEAEEINWKYVEKTTPVKMGRKTGPKKSIFCPNCNAPDATREYFTCDEIKYRMYTCVNCGNKWAFSDEDEITVRQFQDVRNAVRSAYRRRKRKEMSDK